jgi:hypothetical protein
MPLNGSKQAIVHNALAHSTVGKFNPTNGSPAASPFWSKGRLAVGISSFSSKAVAECPFQTFVANFVVLCRKSADSTQIAKKAATLPLATRHCSLRQ